MGKARVLLNILQDVGQHLPQKRICGSQVSPRALKARSPRLEEQAEISILPSVGPWESRVPPHLKNGDSKT